MSSTLPALIPATAFGRPNWRLPHPPTMPSPKSAVEEFYVPRCPPTMNVSIPHLREAISSLESKMAFLLNQKNELESHLDQAVRLQSPILRLPSELLSSIFVTGVLEMGEDSLMVSTLMLVCRYWADVALNTPALWAKIFVSPHHSLERARRKIERSKTCPIDVSINYGPHTEHMSNVTEQITRAMDLFRPALCRTRSFHLCVPNRPQAHAALARCKEDAPLLRTLTIEICHAMQEDYSCLPLPLFNGHTPALRSCALTSFNFGWDLTLLSRLRTLKLDGYFNSHSPSPATLVSILRQCPTLEELTLRNLSDSESGPCVTTVENTQHPPTGKLIQLPRLKKASFHYVGSALTQHIFSQVTVPNLESLQMCYLQNVTPILQSLYAQALTRLPLRYLRIESSLFNEMTFVTLLRRLPSIVRLELVDIEDVSSYFLKVLSSSQPWICPRLESLTLDGCTSLEWEYLRSLIESRLPANSQAYSRQGIPLAPGITMLSSASAAAAAHARSKSHPNIRVTQPPVVFSAQRLRLVDVTRCSQISKEMVQWLRMYVADVKCEVTKGSWRDS
ncbi:hypothetical protein BDN72DRAFT_759242 [Pluteus cervinus]|uniref:Uncharacterized protein n=1 Tax=Pluteus cervinus TaxID=181527 RepID=A0ACD3BB63_9AGAR|nr:hypothetical protein BDN72DRAFT_759242 [Pluteus cervinus]